MDIDRHTRLSLLFQQALAVSGAHRATFAREACGDDDDLFDALIELLRADQDPSPLSSPRGSLVPDPAPIPERIGEFRILQVLGEGGMGTVFDAQQDHPRRRVALKVLRAPWASDDLQRRFALETELLGRLRHPGIAQIFAAGHAEVAGGSLAYFAMEKVDGERLDAWARRTRPDHREVAALVATIAEAVHHAHLNGVIHRDLKPANILVDDDGNPRVLDFGVARATEVDASRSQHTSVGALIGTLPYMSPEQVSGDPWAVDLRTDVYALGCIAYQLLCGALPLDLDDTPVTAAMRRIETEEPLRLRRRIPTIDPDLDAIVHTALEKQKDRRYESAAALASDLRRFLSDLPVSATPLTLRYQLRKLATRNPQMVATLSLLLATGGLGLIGTTSGWVKADARGKEITRQAAEVTRESSRRARVHDFLLEDLLRASDPWEEGRDIRLIDHLARASARVDDVFADDPDLESEVRVTLGQTLRNLGDYEAAERHLLRARSLRRELFGDEARPTLEAAQHLAHVWWDLGRFDEARALAEGSMAIAERDLGPRDPITLALAHRLGLIAHSARDYDEAERWFTLERDVRLKQDGPDDINVLRATASLGLTVMDKHDITRAEGIFEDTLERRRRSLGPNHPDTLFSVSQLAGLRHEQGRRDEAIALLKESAEGLRAAFGAGNYYTVNCVHELAAARIEEQDYKGALLLLDHASAEYQASANPSPHLLARLENSRATTLQALGQGEEALAAYLASLELSERAFGQESVEVATALNNLGAFHASFTGDVEMSLAFLGRALAIWVTVLPSDDPALIPRYTEVARLQMALGLNPDALLLLERALEIARKASPIDPAATASVVANLGDCLSRMGDGERALTLLDEADPMIERWFDATDSVGQYLRSVTANARERINRTAAEDSPSNSAGADSADADDAHQDSTDEGHP